MQITTVMPGKYARAKVGGESAADYWGRLINDHGFRRENLPAMVGYTGTKVHAMRCVTKREDGKLYAAPCYHACGHHHAYHAGDCRILYGEREVTCKACAKKTGGTLSAT